MSSWAGCGTASASTTPRHRSTHYLWDSLAPQGTICADFYSILVPGLKAGRWQPVSGTREYLSSHADQYHWLYPTVFEAYRKAKGVPQDKVWMILFDAGNTIGANYSIHPEYGSSYQASEIIHHRSDVEVFNTAVSVMESYHPSLPQIGFHEVDAIAQEVQKWGAYARAVAVVDSLVWELWTNHIQADPFYRDKTTLIVLSEHGRHDYDFRWHGDDCTGCRRLPFLAVGPDVRRDAIMTTPGDMCDVGPTIAELLGFSMPFARGKVLEEMFPSTPARVIVGDAKNGRCAGQEEPVRMTYTAEPSWAPSIAANSEGLHLVWIESRASSGEGERWDVLYTRSTNDGFSWAEPETIFRSAGDTRYYYATVAANDNCGVVVAVSGFRWVFQAGRYQWGLRSRTRPLGEQPIFRHLADLPPGSSSHDRFPLREITSPVSGSG